MFKRFRTFTLGALVCGFLWTDPLSGRGTEDLSAPGPLAVETLPFSNLSDPSRTTPGPAAGSRFPLLGRRLGKPASSVERPVPIKVHVPATGGAYPVVILSHGAGGDWDTHYAQAQHLASRGYVVLCVEHVGSNRAHLSKGPQFMKSLDAMIHDAGEVFARPKDVSFAVNCAQEWNRSHPRLRASMDLQRIGVMGHSFGAFTTMVVCGMRPALDWLSPRVEPGKGLGPDQSDPRVRCGVALSPQGVGEPFFLRDSFASLRVPLLGISGTLDKQQSGLTAENRRDAFVLWPRGPHKFVWLANARHLDFTDSTGGTGGGLPSPTRGDVQPLVKAATLLFFDSQLKGETGAFGQLTAEGLNPFLRGSVNRVEVFSR